MFRQLLDQLFTMFEPNLNNIQGANAIPPTPFLYSSWLAGWLVGWLAGWLAGWRSLVKPGFYSAQFQLTSRTSQNRILKVLLKTLKTSILSDAPKHLRAERDQLV